MTRQFNLPQKFQYRWLKFGDPLAQRRTQASFGRIDPQAGTVRGEMNVECAQLSDEIGGVYNSISSLSSAAIELLNDSKRRASASTLGASRKLRSSNPILKRWRMRAAA